MRMRTETFTGIAVVLSDWALMASMYAMGTSLGGDEMRELSIWPWLFCALLIYVVNLFLAGKDLSLNTVLGLNVAATLALCAGGLFFWSEARGFVNYLFVIAFFGISGGRSGYLARNPVHPNQMLLYTEVSILFLALVLWIQSVMPEIAKYNGVLFGVLCVDLIALILTRLVTENDTKVSGNKFQGIFMIGAIGILAATLVLGVMMLLSDGVRNLFGGMVAAIVGAAGFVLGGIYRGIMFLFSLIPKSDPGAIPPSEIGGGGAAGGEELAPMDLGHLLPTFLVLLAVAAVAVLIYTMIKGRRTRLSGKAARRRKGRQGVVVKSHLWEKIKAFFRRIKNGILFEVQYMRYRNTPQGLYVQIERYGKRKKLPKESGESPGSYVKRVGEYLVKQEVLERDTAYLRLSEMLDQIFYSGKTETQKTITLPKEIFAEIKKSLTNQNRSDII